MTDAEVNCTNVFHSSIIQQCRIYPWNINSTPVLTYWLCKNDTIQIYKVCDSKPILIKEVNKVFQNYNNEVTDINICGLKIFDDLDKVVLFGRDVFTILSISNILNSSDIYIESKNAGFKVVKCTYWITDIEMTLKECYVLTCYNEILIYNLEEFKLLNRVKQNKVNSISYKGYLKLNNDELVVVSPSVLNGCLVWKYNTTNSKVEYMYKLADDAHYGIIFDTCVDNNYKFLITCSDDRSINIYDYKTGDLLQKLYGHVSRVWKVKFIYKGDSKDLWGIISCSEDCKFITWKFDKSKTNLTKHSTHEVTHIKNCWNIDYYDNQVLSCGNDGRVKLTFIDIEDKSTSRTLKINLNKKEMIKDMIRINNEEYVLLSNNGNIFTIGANDLTNVTSDGIKINSAFKIININYKNMFLSIDKSNKICLFEKSTTIKKLKEIIINDVSKILSLVLVSDIVQNKFEFILDSPNKNDDFILYSFDLLELEITKLFTYSKTTSHQKIPLTITCGYYNCKDESLLVGTLNGKLLHYFKDELVKYKPHNENNEAIISITSTKLKSEDDKQFVLVSTRFQYNLFSLDLSLNAFSNISTSKIENIDYSSTDGFVITTIKDGCYLKFSESKNFTMNQYKMQNNIKASFTGEKNWFAYVYVSNNESYVKIESINSKNDLLIHEGTHGRETRCLTILDENDLNISFVTGSEDTTLKLYSYDKLHNSFESKHTMTYRGHVSGLQTSGKIELGCGKKLFLSTSAKEELFFWSFNNVVDETTKSSDVYLNLECRLPTTKDLKKDKNAINNIELRVTCFCFDSKNNILYTCYSNSMIRSWKIDFDKSTNEYKITITNEIFYKQCSIFDCTLMSGYLVLGTSEGILVSYKINDYKLELSDCLNVHQNGIMSIEKMKDDYLITGGDDNAIALTSIDSSTGIFTILNQATNVSNSAITNVQRIKDDEFIFTSIDQLVGTYQIDYPNKTLKEIKKFYTNIADTQSIDVSKNLVFLGGLGLSIYKDLI